MFFLLNIRTGIVECNWTTAVDHNFLRRALFPGRPSKWNWKVEDFSSKDGEGPK